ncbi:MAG: hypothetical protein ACE5FI_00015 [Anaerolineales bacterium]
MKNICLFVALAAPLLAACASTPTPSTEAHIAYEMEHENLNFEIYSIKPDGTGRQRLTLNLWVDVDPAWSPDHSQLAFASNRAGNFGIYVMRADGTRARALTANTGEVDDFAPNWSPDGSRMVFISFQDENWELYVMDVGRSGPGENLTRLTFNDADDIEPDWSSDGRRLLFTSMRDGNWEIYAMDTACFNQPDTCADRSVRLTDNDAEDFEPQWSPDGSRITWFTDRDGNYEIYVMDADGGRPRRLTVAPGADTHPSWSPDGQFIVFHSTRAGGDHLFIMNSNGTAPTQLTFDDRVESDAAWRR